MSRSTYQVPLWNRIGRKILVPIFWVLFRVITRAKIYGVENIPEKGPYIVIFNHVSIVDPPFVICHLPKPPEILGAVDVWNKPGQNLLAQFYGGIQIHRGEVDRKAMEQALAAIRTGKPLMISPEGGRSHVPGLRRAKSGIVYIIEQTRVPVVPVAVIGTTDENFHQTLRGKRPLLTMQIGQPFLLPEIAQPGFSPKDIRQAKADYIMERLADLLPEEYRGVYATKNSPTSIAQAAD